jgi:IclR family KDG regulon transcriptional repressor
MNKPLETPNVFPRARQPLQTVVKALATLRLFTLEREWLGVREIARLLDINTATVHNLLRTLMDTGLVEQHLETKKYRLGLGLVRLAGTKLAQLDVVTASAGPMKELLNKTGETISLAVLYGDELVYLARMESLQPVRVTSRIGGSAPIHASAHGKSLLAFLDDGSIDRLLKPPLLSFTAATVTDVSKLRTELKQIRDQDYAVDHGAYLPDVHAVASPIRDSSGHVIASLAIVALASRFPAAKVKAYAKLVKDAAGRISSALGYRYVAPNLRLAKI